MTFIFLVIKANILPPKNFSFCKWFCSMPSTVSVLLLINKKRRHLKKKKFYLPYVFFASWRCWRTVPGCETRKPSSALGVESEGQGGQLDGAEEREEWPCIRAGLGRLALRPPTQQPAPPNAASQVSPRAQSKETKHRQSQSCCPPQNTWLESVTTALYQLPLCSCLLSDKVDWDTQHRIPLLSNCI